MNPEFLFSPARTSRPGARRYPIATVLRRLTAPLTLTLLAATCAVAFADGTAPVTTSNTNAPLRDGLINAFGGLLEPQQTAVTQTSNTTVERIRSFDSLFRSQSVATNALGTNLLSQSNLLGAVTSPWSNHVTTLHGLTNGANEQGLTKLAELLAAHTTNSSGLGTQASSATNIAAKLRAWLSQQQASATSSSNGVARSALTNLANLLAKHGSGGSLLATNSVVTSNQLQKLRDWLEAPHQAGASSTNNPASALNALASLASAKMTNVTVNANATNLPAVQGLLGELGSALQSAGTNAAGAARTNAPLNPFDFLRGR